MELTMTGTKKYPKIQITRYREGKRISADALEGYTPGGYAKVKQFEDGAVITQLYKSNEWKINYRDGDTEYARIF